MVEFFDPVTNKNISYHILPKFQQNLDKIKTRLQKKDQDFVFVIDGYEGSGKSVFGMQVGKYVDPTLTLDRVCMSPEQFKQAIVKAKQHQCVIFDEAFTGLSSRSSLSGINRVLVSMMMQMRQKNLFVIVILPNVFMLDKYVALSRAKSLLHVWEKNGNHYWKCYNRRRLKELILTGGKTYSYHQIGKYVNYKGHFFGKYVLDEEAYREKKRKALEETEEHVKEPKYLRQRDILFWILSEKAGYTGRKITKLCNANGISLGETAISEILRKVRERIQNPNYNYTIT